MAVSRSAGAYVPRLIALLALLVSAYVFFTTWKSQELEYVYGQEIDDYAQVDMSNQRMAITRQSLHRQKSKALAAAGRGFQNASPSCRITDLPEDPLVQEYGETNIRLSRTYEGSGTRIRRVLQKAMRGEGITIAVVGGSVSAGHGISWPWTRENHAYTRILDWLEQNFPNQGHKLDMRAAIPATTNLYFSYCLLEHLVPDPDLVLIELDINSVIAAEDTVGCTDAIYRTVLNLPSQPAIIWLSVLALALPDLSVGFMHTPVLSQWFDTPQINIRNFLLPDLLLHPENKTINDLYVNHQDWLDTKHMNQKGHRSLGDMTIAYLREQLCLLERNSPVVSSHSDEWPHEDITETIPRLHPLSPWSQDAVIPPFNPRCSSIISTHDPLQPSRNFGWVNATNNDKVGWQATVLGSEISFDFETAAGHAGIWYWHAWQKDYASVDCWIDQDKRPERIRRLNGHAAWMTAPVFDWSRSIFDDLTPGTHRLTCKTLEGVEGGTIFRISGLVTR